MAILKMENVSFSYDKKRAVLKNISLEIKKGEYVAVIGHNGSGKSTLAKLMNGLIFPDTGSITVSGISTFKEGSEQKDKSAVFEIRKKVGVVFQNPDNQLVASIVEDDVAFGPENIGAPRKEIGERIDFALSAVGMQEFRHRTPSRLSGGQKQRIAIAGVLALKPEILVLDESTAMLDPKGRKEVLSVVEKLNKEQNVTVITVTHYMDEVVHADRVIVMSDGEMVMQGTPEEIFKREEEIKKYGLELPVSTVIANKLRAKGLNIPEGIFTPEGLAEALCGLKQKA